MFRILCLILGLCAPHFILQARPSEKDTDEPRDATDEEDPDPIFGDQTLDNSELLRRNGQADGLAKPKMIFEKPSFCRNSGKGYFSENCADLYRALEDCTRHGSEIKLLDKTKVYRHSVICDYFNNGEMEVEAAERLAANNSINQEDMEREVLVSTERTAQNEAYDELRQESINGYAANLRKEIFEKELALLVESQELWENNITFSTQVPTELK